jgi:hypothetical protein
VTTTPYPQCQFCDIDEQEKVRNYQDRKCIEYRYKDNGETVVGIACPDCVDRIHSYNDIELVSVSDVRQERNSQ